MSAFNTIKFSKEYVKLHGQRSAELLAVQRVSIPHGVSPELLEYDTEATDGSRYELKPGKYILLVFLGELGIPFTTIRPDTPAMKGKPVGKYEYYDRKVAQKFRIVRTWEEPDGQDN